MTDRVNDSQTTVREVVALFETRATFDRAVAGLLDAGFDREDISVLASHTTLDAADATPPADEALAGLVGELKYAFPLATAGLIAIVGGPLTATIAAAVAAGVGGLAIKDYLDEVTAHPDPGAFANALEEGGVVMWVRTTTAEEEARAATVLDAAGGRNIHSAEREE